MNATKLRPFETITKATPVYMTETITPGYAEQILANNNDGNRKIREAHVKSMSISMLRGLWQPTGNDAICFDCAGRLLNGQHRFSAVVLSGVAVKMLVGRNIPTESFSVMDTGSKRSSGDFLHHEGIQNYNAVATLGRIYLSRTVENGKTTAFDTMKTTRGNLLVTNNDLLEFYRNNSTNVDTAVRLANNSLNRMMPMSHISIALFHLIEEGADHEEVCQFAHDFRPDYKGDLPSNAPARVACRFFMNLRMLRKHVSMQEAVGIIIMAYNDYVTGTIKNNYKTTGVLHKVKSK